MEEMGDDEVLALVVSLGLGGWGALGWYLNGLRTSQLGEKRGARLLLMLLPPIALYALWHVLAVDAAADVRNDGRYQFLFLAMGSIWVFLLPRALSFIGISFRDDALERRNAAASFAIAGTLGGLAALFAGSNMGEGPTIWDTVETALAATAILYASVFVLALVTSVGDTIAVERDAAAGLRFAGWALGSGLVLGAASAGDWVSDEAMIRDLFVYGWPVFALLVVAVAVELAFRPRASAPRPSALATGVVPAVLYLVVSLAYVSSLRSAG